MSKHFRVPALLPLRLQEAGIPSSVLLRNAGLPGDLFQQPRMLVTTDELFSLWREIGRLSPNPAIGILLGTEDRTERFDPIALAALSNATFGEAMRQLSSHKQLSCPEEIVHEVDAAEWSVQFRWLLADGAEPAVLNDLCFAWVLSIARHGTGSRICPVRLELVKPRAYAAMIERHFGCPVVAGAERNAIVFRASDAALPFGTRNAELLSVLAPHLDRELREHRGQETFADRVRAAIQRHLAGRRPKVPEIARELFISSRTLQRRLQDDGFSFQQVLEQARHQMARHYLNNSLLELNEAAYLLGFENVSSFVRAFRTWEGVPPARWRDAQRTPTA